jgi:hypothetical protein
MTSEHPSNRRSLSADKSTRLFQPVFLQFNDTAAANPGNGSKSIGVILSFFAKLPASTAPTAADAKTADISVPFSFGMVKRGTYLDGTKEGSVIFRNQLRSAPIKIGNQVLPDTLDSYAFVSESADPSFFDTEVQKAVADKSFATMLTTLLTPPAAAKATK